MKENNIQKSRVKSVLGNDRLNISKEYMSLITHDLQTLMREYFEQPENLEITINSRPGGYDFSLNATALRIKPFNIIP